MIVKIDLKCCFITFNLGQRIVQCHFSSVPIIYSTRLVTSTHENILLVYFRLLEDSPRFIQRVEERKMADLKSNRLKMKQYDLVRVMPLLKSVYSM